jgi:hypothetical protein
MKYLKCIKGTYALLGPSRNWDRIKGKEFRIRPGIIYKLLQKDISSNGCFHRGWWAADRFTEISNVERLLIMGKKIKPRRMP